jgi:hypothetical protein
MRFYEDGELEHDPYQCSIHDCERPCQHCRDDQSDRQYDDRRERDESR